MVAYGITVFSVSPIIAPAPAILAISYTNMNKTCNYEDVMMALAKKVTEEFVAQHKYQIICQANQCFDSLIAEQE